MKLIVSLFLLLQASAQMSGCQYSSAGGGVRVADSWVLWRHQDNFATFAGAKSWEFQCRENPACRGYSIVWIVEQKHYQIHFHGQRDVSSFLWSAVNSEVFVVSSCPCSPGSTYWDNYWKTCTGCRSCPSGQTSNGGCSGSSDRSCRGCTQPSATQYVVGTCSTFQDTIMQTCTATCPANTWRSALCVGGTPTSPGTNTFCSPCLAVCDTDQYISQTCSSVSNAVCSTCRACAALGTEYMSRDCIPTETRNRECSSCTRCASGAYTNRTCGVAIDSTCTDCEADRYVLPAPYEMARATARTSTSDLPTYAVTCGDGAGLPAQLPNSTLTNALILYGSDEERTMNSTCWNGTTLQLGGWSPDFRAQARQSSTRSLCYDCWHTPRSLAPVYVIGPKYNRTDRLMDFQCVPGYEALPMSTQPVAVNSSAAGAFSKKCYSSGGDDADVLDSVLQGRQGLECKCRDIPGAHNCSSDTTQELWTMDGATSFTRHTYRHSDWRFDPTHPENRGQILVSFQPYMRLIDGGIEEFYLSDTLSDWPGGRLVFLADNLDIGLTVQVRSAAGVGSIRLDQDVDLWFGAAAALSNKNQDATIAAAITTSTDLFHFDMRFHSVNGASRDLATGARRAYFSSLGRSVNDIRPGEFPPAWGVRMEWLHRKCGPGTYQVGDDCVACPDLTCTPLWYQVSKRDGSNGCRPCVCGGKALEEETACFNCTTTCACALLPDACHINNVCRARNEPRTGSDTCNQCRPDQSQSVWTALTEPDITCDDGDICTNADSCNSGVCRGERLQCLSLEQTGDVNQACEVCGGNSGCVQDPEFAGCVAILDEADPSNRTCGCLIGDQCFPHMASNPDNFCEQCDVQLDPTGWSLKPPVDCDDGQACTYGDVCQQGVCAGISYECTYDMAPCVQSAQCNGRGQCDFTYKPSTTLCSPGDGVCLQDRFCTGRNGYCPPKPALIPTITPGNVTIMLADSTTPVERGWPVSLADRGSPYIRALYLSVQNWTVMCGSMEFSVGWYADTDGTLGCSDAAVQSSDAASGAGYAPYALGEGTANVVSGLSAAGELAPAPFGSTMRISLLTAVNSSTGSGRVPQPTVLLPGDLNASEALSVPVPGYEANSSIRRPTWVVPIVKARNVQGREWAMCLGRIAVDNSPPIVGIMRNLNPTLPEDDGFTYDTHPGTYLSFTWDPFAEDFASTWGGFLKYSWAVGRTPGSADVYPWTYAGIGASSATTLNEYVPAPFGVDLYVTIRGHNRAGLVAELRGDPVLLDPTPAVNCSLFDGVELDADGSPVQQSFTSDARSVLSLTISGCRDLETAVSSYVVCWGTAPGQCDAVAPRTYRNPGRNSFNASIFRATEQRAVIPGQRYFATVRVLSGSGASIVLPTSLGRVLDTDAPRAVAVLVPSFVASASFVDLRWSYEEAESAVVAARVTVRGTGLRERGRVLVSDRLFADVRDIARGLRVPITGRHSLTNTFEYEVCAELINAANLSSARACATFTADLTPPVLPGSVILAHPDRVAGDAIIALDRPSFPIAARWLAAQEDLSGIASYSVRVTTDGVLRPAASVLPLDGPGQRGITDWIQVQTGTLALVAPPTGAWTAGWTYWLTLRVESGAGTVVERTSPGLWVGSGGAPASARPFIYLPEYPDRPSSWWGRSDILHVSFSGLNDVFAGIADYSVGVGDCAGAATIASVVPWTSLGSNGGSTRATVEGMTLTTGQQYCVSVRAKSNTGLVSQNTSLPFVLDLSAPVVPLAGRALDLPVADGAITGSLSGPDIDYSAAVNSTHAVLGASWPAFTDADSGMLSYWVCVGRAAGVCDLASEVDAGNRTQWTGHIPAPGLSTRVFMTVFGLNRGGVRTNISTDGLLFDPRPPVAGYALYLDAHTSPQQQAILLASATGSTPIPVYSSQLAASPIRLLLSGFTPAGTLAQPGAPITHFTVDVGTAPGGTQHVSARQVGLDTEVALATTGSLALTSGKVFCVSVTAVAANGRRSRAVQRTCLVYDPSPVSSFQARIAFATSQSAHMPIWPAQQYLSVCISGLGDAQSGVFSSSVSIGMSGFGGLWASQDFTVDAWSNRLPGTAAAACTTISGLALRTGVRYVATMNVTNGAGLTTTASTPVFLVDSRAPAPAELILPVHATSTVVQPASVHVLPPFQSLSSLRVHFTAGAEVSLENTTDGTEYWAALGTEGGLSDVSPWRRLTAVSRTTVQGPVGPLIVLSGMYDASPSVSSLRMGRWLLSLRSIKQSVSQLIGSVQVDQALLDSSTAEVSSVGAVLLDNSVPVFPSTPMVLPSSSAFRLPTQGSVQSTGRYNGSSAEAVSDRSQVDAVWLPATVPAGFIAFYTACIVHSPSGVGGQQQADVCVFAGNGTAVTFTGLSLIEGQQYRVVVRAVSASNVTGSATSLPFIVDSIAPVMTGEPSIVRMPDAGHLSGPAEFVADASAVPVVEGFATGVLAGSIYFQWTPATDSVSNVRYAVSVGSSPCGVDMLPVTFLDSKHTKLTQSTLLGTAGGVRLVEGTPAYVSVIAVDAAGNSARACSTGKAPIVVTRAPLATGMAARLPFGSFQASNSTIVMNISHPGGLSLAEATSVAPVNVTHPVLPAGLSHYLVCVPRADNPICNTWRSFPVADSFAVDGLRLVHGVQYTVLLRAVSYSNLSTTVQGPNVTFDRTPPVVGNVSIPAFLGQNSTVSVAWRDATDDVSPLVSVRIRVEAVVNTPTWATVPVSEWATGGVGAEGSVTVEVDTSSVGHGTVLTAAVQTCNAAGLCSERRFRVSALVDLTAPEAPAEVRILTRAGTTGNHTPYVINSTILHALWGRFMDAESGMVSYAVAVGLQPGGQQIRQFLPIGNVTSITLSGLVMEPGAQVYVTVRGTNGAGLRSVSSSASTLISPLRPTAFQVHDGALLDEIELDPVPASQAGVALGVNTTCVTVVPHPTIPGIICTNSTIGVYTSNIGRSGDPLGAVAGDADYDSDRYLFPYRNVGCHWSESVEVISGLSHYIVSMGTARGRADVINTTRIEAGAPRYIYTRLRSAAPSGTLFCTVTAVSRAGLARLVISDGAAVDRTPPILTGVPRSVKSPSSSSAAFQRETDRMAITWPGLAIDPESGVAQWQVALVVAGGQAHRNLTSGNYSSMTFIPDGCPWVSIGPGVTSATLGNLTLRHGLSYIPIAKAINPGLGHSLIAVGSASVRIDTNAIAVQSTVAALASSVSGFQDGLEAVGLARFGYLAQPALAESLAVAVNGSAPDSFIPQAAAWRPALTANIPWTGSIASPDNRVCVFNNRPGEVPVTAKLSDRMQLVYDNMDDPFITDAEILSPEWAARAVPDNSSKVMHGSMCGPGYFRSPFGLCAPCPPGTYKDGVSDATDCSLCGQFTWFKSRSDQFGMGHAARAMRAADTSEETDRSMCACLDYRTQTFDADSGECVCKAGYFLPSTAAVPDMTQDPSPPVPPEGSIRGLENPWCSECPSGTYKAEAGNARSMCLRCPNGTSVNSDRTGCECSDPSQVWSDSAKACVCGPGMFLDPAPIDGSPPTCVMCIGRLQYKDVPGNDRRLCLRCPFGTLPDEATKGFCVSNVQGMVYEHRAGAGRENKGYCPAGTTLQYRGTEDVTYEGMAWVYRDPVHGYDDWERTEGNSPGVQCYRSAEDFDTGDEYFDLGVGLKMWDYDARDGSLWITRDFPDWDIGLETSDGWKLPAPPAYSSDHTPPSGLFVFPDTHELWTRIYPRHRSTPAFRFWLKWLHDPSSKLARASELRAFQSLQNKEIRAAAQKHLELLSDGDKIKDPVPTVLLNPFVFFPDRSPFAMGLMKTFERGGETAREFLEGWVDRGTPDAPKSQDEIKESIRAWLEDVDMRMYNATSYLAAQWAYIAAASLVAELSSEGYGKSPAEAEITSLAFQALQAEKIMYPIKLRVSEILDAIFTSRTREFYYQRRLTAIAAEMQQLHGDVFDGDLMLFDFHKKMADKANWNENDLMDDYIKEDVFTAEEDEDPSASKDMQTQWDGKRLTSGKWGRWAAIFNSWRENINAGTYKLMPSRLGSSWTPSAGSGLYSLSRKYGKCYFTRPRPVHACVPCDDGLIQPWPIALDTGFWQHKTRSEGQCTECPAFSESVRNITAGPAGSLGAINFFLVANLTTLHLDWSHVWQTDDISGLRQFSYALGSVPGGAQYLPMTPMRPPRATSTKIDLDAEMVERFGLQAGAPIFLSVQAMDVAGNVATYADTNPVLWDPNGPLPGDIKDGSLDDYLPPAVMALATQPAAAPAARRLSERNGAAASSRATEPTASDLKSSSLHLLGSVFRQEQASNGASRASTGRGKQDGTGSPVWLAVAAAPNWRAQRKLQFGAVPANASNLEDAAVLYDWRQDPTLTDITYMVDLDHWTDPTRLEVTYEAFSSMAAGISALSYCVGSQPYACDILPSTEADGVDGSLPTANTLEISDLELSVPSTVYVTISAVSGSGLVATVTTDGIRVDNRPPYALPGLKVVDTGRYSLLPESRLGAGGAATRRAPPVDVNCDAAYAGVGAAWSGFVAPLGVKQYDWCVGSVAQVGSCDLLPWTSVGLATSVYNATLQFPEGTVYFVSVRVTDNIEQTLSAMSDGVRTVAGTMPLPMDTDANATQQSDEGLPLDDSETVVFNATEYIDSVAAGVVNPLNISDVGAEVRASVRADPRDRFLCDTAPLDWTQSLLVAAGDGESGPAGQDGLLQPVIEISTAGMPEGLLHLLDNAD